MLETFNGLSLLIQPHATRPKTINCTKKDRNHVTKVTKSIVIREMFKKIARAKIPRACTLSRSQFDLYKRYGKREEH